MISITLAVIFACSLVKFGLAETADPALSIDVLKKMPIKTLKSMIESKGLECLGCSEKDDYVKMAFDSLTLPTAPLKSVPPKAENPPENSPKPESEETPEDKEKKKKDLDDLMASLKKGGFGNSKIFSADDLKDMSPDEMSEKLSGKRKKSESKSKKGNEKSKSKSNSSKKFKTRTANSKKSNKKGGSKSDKKSKPAQEDNVPRPGTTSEKQQRHFEEEGETIEL